METTSLNILVVLELCSRYEKGPSEGGRAQVFSAASMVIGTSRSLKTVSSRLSALIDSPGELWKASMLEISPETLLIKVSGWGPKNACIVLQPTVVSNAQIGWETIPSRRRSSLHCQSWRTLACFIYLLTYIFIHPSIHPSIHPFIFV